MAGLYTFSASGSIEEIVAHLIDYNAYQEINERELQDAYNSSSDFVDDYSPLTELAQEIEGTEAEITALIRIARQIENKEDIDLDEETLSEVTPEYIAEQERQLKTLQGKMFLAKTAYSELHEAAEKLRADSTAVADLVLDIETTQKTGTLHFYWSGVIAWASATYHISISGVDPDVDDSYSKKDFSPTKTVSMQIIMSLLVETVSHTNPEELRRADGPKFSAIADYLWDKTSPAGKYAQQLDKSLSPGSAQRYLSAAFKVLKDYIPENRR